MLSEGRRRAIAIVIIAAVVTTGIVLAVVWVDRGESTAREIDGRDPDQSAVSIRESVVEHSRGGKPSWQLNIEEIEISGGGRSVAATDLREGLVYDAAGKPVVRISAGTATYRTTDRSFEVTGGVNVVSHRGAIINTESVQWLPETQILRCPARVTMRTEGATVTTENLDVVVQEDIARTPDRVQVRTEHGHLSGRNLVYNLQTHEDPEEAHV